VLMLGLEVWIVVEAVGVVGRGRGWLREVEAAGE